MYYLNMTNCCFVLRKIYVYSAIHRQRFVVSRLVIVTRVAIYLILFTNPSARTGYDTRSIFKRSLTGLNSEFSFSKTSCLTKAEEPSLSYYLAIAGGRIIGFIPFPRVLVQCEMQSVSSRIWIRIVSPCSFPTAITTTPRAPPYIYIYIYI